MENRNCKCMYRTEFEKKNNYHEKTCPLNKRSAIKKVIDKNK